MGGNKYKQTLADFVYWRNYKLDSKWSKRCSGLGVTKLMGSDCRYCRIDIYIYGNEKVVILQFVINLTLEIIQNSSNSNHTQCYESQLSVMLFIGQGVEITQYRFSRQ